MDREDLVFFGGEIKALGDGKIGGYLVRFGSADEADLYGEYFTKATDFDLETTPRAAIYYNHGLDPVLKQRKLGTGDMVEDEVGIWIEAQLSMRDAYEKAIYGMAQKGKLGWSSGTAPHLMSRNNGHIERWPIIDASITPTPAEPRTQAVAIKALANATAGPVEVCAYLSQLTAQTLAMMPAVATPEDELRITIARFDALTAIESATLVSVIGDIVFDTPAMGGEFVGTGWSHQVGGEVDVMFAIPNVRGLDDIRTEILHEMNMTTSAEQLPYARLAIAGTDAPLPDINRRQFPLPVSLDAISILSDGDREDYPFAGQGTSLSTTLEPEAEAAMPEGDGTSSATVVESSFLSLELYLLEMETAQ